MTNKRQNMGDGIEKIIQDPKFAGKLIMKNMLPVKMSAVILDFAKPLLDKIDLPNKSITERTIHRAIEIWNYSIVIDRSCVEAGAADNKLYRLAMAKAVKQNLSFRISKTDYDELLNRKEALYPDNNFFIIEHNVSWSDDDEQFQLAVVTGDASKVKR